MRRRVLLVLVAAALAALPFAWATWRALFMPNDQWVGPTGNHFGLDFVNFWAAGRLVLEGLVAKGYDPEAYKALLASWFAPATGFTNLSYPPSLLPWLAPLATLPYLVAYVLWSLAGALAFISAVLGRLPARGDATAAAALIISPVIISNVVFGQIALFVAALFVFAMRLMPVRPALAGVLIGFMTLKPQLGLLLPVFLLASGQWRTIAAAAVTALLLAGLSIAMFGVAPWHAYLTDTAQLQWSYILAMNDFYAIHMTTPYAALWTLGVPVKTALACQWMISGLVVAITVAVARSAADWPLKAALVGFGSVMVVPYVLAHDLAMPLAALVWYLNTRENEPSPAELSLSGMLWLLPFPLTFLVQAMGVPATELVMLGLYAVLALRALSPLKQSSPPVLQPAGP